MKVFSLESFPLHDMTLIIVTRESRYFSCFYYYYSCISGMERGTLYQLRNLINQRNVKKVKSDVNANEDFFTLVVTAHNHLICPVLIKFPHLESYNPQMKFGSRVSDRKAILDKVSSLVVEQYVNLSTIFSNPRNKHNNLPGITDRVNPQSRTPFPRIQRRHTRGRW